MSWVRVVTNSKLLMKLSNSYEAGSMTSNYFNILQTYCVFLRPGGVISLMYPKLSEFMLHANLLDLNCATVNLDVSSSDDEIPIGVGQPTFFRHLKDFLRKSSLLLVVGFWNCSLEVQRNHFWLTYNQLWVQTLLDELIKNVQVSDRSLLYFPDVVKLIMCN